MSVILGTHGDRLDEHPITAVRCLFWVVSGKMHNKSRRHTQNEQLSGAHPGQRMDFAHDAQRHFVRLCMQFQPLARRISARTSNLFLSPVFGMKLALISSGIGMYSRSFKTMEQVG